MRMDTRLEVDFYDSFFHFSFRTTLPLAFPALRCVKFAFAFAFAFAFHFSLYA